MGESGQGVVSVDKAAKDDAEGYGEKRKAGFSLGVEILVPGEAGKTVVWQRE